MKDKSSLNEESGEDSGIDSSHCTQKNLNLSPYWGLVCLRVLLTVFPQSGYVHPDEFFQSVEVVAGDVFGVEVFRAWEFNSTRPIRSIVFPYLVSWLPFSIEKYFWPFGKNGIIPPYILLIGPRIIVCLISFISDYCLYRTCYIYGQNYRARLMAFATSYVAIVYGTRTLSNSIEMALTSLVLYCVAEAMCHTDQVLYQDSYLQEKLDQARGIAERVKIARLKSKLPNHTLRHCPILGAALAFGIFIRPTFLAFSAPAIFFWLRRGPRKSQQTKSTPAKFIASGTVELPPSAHFHVRAASLAVCAIFLAIPLLVADTRYYITTREDINPVLPVVATPFNFLIYNTNRGNLQEHGLHPRWLHVLVNLPLLFGPLGIFALLGLGRLAWLCIRRRWARLPRSESPTALMVSSLVLPLLVLSMIPHQEPRFLLPLAFPMAYLYAQDIRGPTSDEESGDGILMRLYKIVPHVWFLFNIIFGLFYGFIHQGGVWPVTSELAHRLSDYKSIPWRVTEVHIFTSHTYNLPRHPLQLRPKPNTRVVRFHEMGSKDPDEVMVEILAWQKSKTSPHRRPKKYGDQLFYLVVPGVLEKVFLEEASKHSLEVALEWSHFPHLSMEAPLSWRENVENPQSCSDEVNGECLLKNELVHEHDLDEFTVSIEKENTFKSFTRKFSLLLYRVFLKCSDSGDQSCLQAISY
ncbi:GPI mannosyltransferase 4 isoform X1 [Hetaerina americana]|uniref:GPI mannosyltransferase 4 isoform X1 n=1 Tax=Hetaerina americana TaxID=62018 RepID=UPI003A7F2DE4